MALFSLKCGTLFCLFLVSLDRGEIYTTNTFGNQGIDRYVYTYLY